MQSPAKISSHGSDFCPIFNVAIMETKNISIAKKKKKNNNKKTNLKKLVKTVLLTFFLEKLNQHRKIYTVSNQMGTTIFIKQIQMWCCYEESPFLQFSLSH